MWGGHYCVSLTRCFIRAFVKLSTDKLVWIWRVNRHWSGFSCVSERNLRL